MLIFAAGRGGTTATIAEPKATRSRAFLKLHVNIRNCCRKTTIAATDVILNLFVLHAKDERYYIESDRIGCDQSAISALRRRECVLCGRRIYKGC